MMILAGGYQQVLKLIYPKNTLPSQPDSLIIASIALWLSINKQLTPTLSPKHNPSMTMLFAFAELPHHQQTDNVGIYLVYK